MKYINIYTLFLISAFGSSCGQNQTNSSKETIKAETKDGINKVAKYEYTDPMGKRLIIQNGFPRGEPYTDPNGKEYFKVIFWTRIINETDSPLEFKIDFPVDSYEVPSLPGEHVKILIPPDTMTVDKESLFNYGLTGLKSFLDTSIDKPSTLKRTINPKGSSGFYVVMLGPTTKVASGITRTGLSLKGQDLFYRFSRYASAPGLPLINEKEIHCGSINLKNLMLRK